MKLFKENLEKNDTFKPFIPTFFEAPEAKHCLPHLLAELFKSRKVEEGDVKPYYQSAKVSEEAYDAMVSTFKTSMIRSKLFKLPMVK